MSSLPPGLAVVVRPHPIHSERDDFLATLTKARAVRGLRGIPGPYRRLVLTHVLISSEHVRESRRVLAASEKVEEAAKQRALLKSVAKRRGSVNGSSVSTSDGSENSDENCENAEQTGNSQRDTILRDRRSRVDTPSYHSDDSRVRVQRIMGRLGRTRAHNDGERKGTRTVSRGFGRSSDQYPNRDLHLRHNRKYNVVPLDELRDALSSDVVGHVSEKDPDPTTPVSSLTTTQQLYVGNELTTEPYIRELNASRRRIKLPPVVSPPLLSGGNTRPPLHPQAGKSPLQLLEARRLPHHLPSVSDVDPVATRASSPTKSNHAVVGQAARPLTPLAL
eukprot:PhM_4_TR13116/c0_g1_i1/m.70632